MAGLGKLLARFLRKGAAGLNRMGGNWFTKLFTGPVSRKLSKTARILTKKSPKSGKVRIFRNLSHDFSVKWNWTVRKVSRKYPFLGKVMKATGFMGRGILGVSRTIVSGVAMVGLIKAVSGVAKMFGGGGGAIPPPPQRAGGAMAAGGPMAASGAGMARMQQRHKSMSQRGAGDDELDIKIAEARANYLAIKNLYDPRLIPQSRIPSNLPEVPPGHTNEERLDAVVSLLNMANKIANETRILNEAGLKLELRKTESEVRKASELYNSLRRLKSQKNTANADAVAGMGDSGGGGAAMAPMMAASVAMPMVEATNRGFGDMKKGLGVGIAALGALAVTGSFIKNGIAGIWEGMTNEMQSLKDLVSKFFGYQVEKDSRAEGLEAQLAKAQDEDERLAQEHAARMGNDSKELSDISDVERESGRAIQFDNLEDLDEDGDNYNQHETNTSQQIMEGGLAMGIGAYDMKQALKKKAEKEAVESAAGEAAEKVGKEAVETVAEKTAGAAASGTTKAVAEGASTAGKAASGAAGKVAETAAKKGGGWFSRFTDGFVNASIKVAGKVQKAWGATKSVAAKVGNALAKSFKNNLNTFIIGPTWKLITKITGPKVAGILKTFFKAVGEASKKVAGKAAKKAVPGFSLVFGIASAIQRGFVQGDWWGALFDAISGIAYSFPGIGTAIGAAVDALSVVRDIYRSNQLEKDTKEVQALLDQKKASGEYSPGDSSVYDDAINAFGPDVDENNWLYGDSRKRNQTDLITSIDKLDQEKKDKGISGEEYYKRLNELHKKHGSKVRYDSSGKRLLDEGVKVNFSNGIGDRINAPYIQGVMNPFTGRMGAITSNFKEKTKKDQLHSGVDFDGKAGEHIKHPFEGTVMKADPEGQMLKIKNNDGTFSTYHHMDPTVKEGDTVKKGDDIGAVSSYVKVTESGNREPHIHYEHRNQKGELVNPLPSLAKSLNMKDKDAFTPKGGPSVEESNAEFKQEQKKPTVQQKKPTNIVDQRILYASKWLSENSPFTIPQQAGILGTLLAESRLDPKVINKWEAKKFGRDSHVYGRGIAQWSNRRNLEFKEWYAKKHGGEGKFPEETEMDDQLEYLLLEMSKRPKFMRTVQGTSDIAVATDAMLRGYENGGPRAFASEAQLDEIYTKVGSGTYRKMFGDRLKFANRVYKLLTGNEFDASQINPQSLNGPRAYIPASGTYNGGSTTSGTWGADYTPTIRKPQGGNGEGDENNMGSFDENTYEGRERRRDDFFSRLKQDIVGIDLMAKPTSSSSGSFSAPTAEYSSGANATAAASSSNGPSPSSAPTMVNQSGDTINTTVINNNTYLSQNDAKGAELR